MLSCEYCASLLISEVTKSQRNRRRQPIVRLKLLKGGGGGVTVKEA